MALKITRQTLSESWDDGKILPRSHLGLMVRQLVDDCSIQLMMTCPVASFMGTGSGVAAGRAMGTAQGCTGANSTKTMMNPEIPLLCKTTVAAFGKLHPALSVMDMVKKGGIKFGGVQIGGKVDCSNFNLLGKCLDPTCTYNHKPAKVGEERQIAIAKKIVQVMAYRR
jgi:hypothetical protein